MMSHRQQAYSAEPNSLLTDTTMKTHPPTPIEPFSRWLSSNGHICRRNRRKPCPGRVVGKICAPPDLSGRNLNTLLDSFLPLRISIRLLSPPLESKRHQDDGKAQIVALKTILPNVLIP